MYYRCPVCGKNYKGRIPKGGDGSAFIFPKHKRHSGVPLSIGAGKFMVKAKPDICPGSYRFCDE